MRVLILKKFLPLLFLISLLPLHAQSVKGVVKDADDNTPLPGVTVQIKGTTNGASTDLDGNYTLQVSPNATLVFSYIGYKSVEMNVNNQTTIDIALEVDLTELNEVVVVGYGTLKKREITGSISRIGGAELMEVQTPSFEAALQGKAAGVQVIQSSGLAGSGSLIRIRGISSISAGGDPLYVVDGIPITQSQFTNASRNQGAMNTNPLATINPNDIASIEILKDAAAAGIYGSRGANGVVLITTKRGKSNQNSFNYSTKIGISEPVAKPRMLNTQQYLQLYQEAWENDGNTGRATLPNDMTWEEIQRRNIDTDWWDLTTQTGFKQEHNFSWNKGWKKLRLYSGVSYSDNESYLAGNSYERMSGRINADYDISDQTKISLSASYVRGNNERVNAAWSGGLGNAMSTSLPIYPVYNDDGSFRVGISNPVRQQSLTDWNTIDQRIITNLNIRHQFDNGINLSLGGSYDYFKTNDDKWEAGEWVGRDDIVGQAFANISDVDNYNGTLTADYTFDINGSTLKVLVGAEYQQSVRNALTGKGAINVDEQLRFDPFVEFDSLRIPGERINSEVTKFASFFARFNYNISNKYFFQATLRTDGSSKFGPENQFGFFPTIGASWFASEEDFLKGNNVISLLKLKANFGITGNSDFPPNQWRDSFQRRGNGNDVGYAFNPTLFPVRYANPDLQWETTNSYDAGFELGFLNDRILIELDYYYKYTKDVIGEIALPPQTGIDDKYFDNFAEISNQGIELSVSTTNIDNGAFQWTTNFNISKNANNVESIGDFSEDAIEGGTNDTRIIVGQPIGTNFLVKFAGVDPQTGLPIYLDKNGEETMDWDPAYRVPLGSVLPDFTGGITNTFTYKNWNFSFLFVFTKGGDIYDSSSKRQLGVITDWNMRRDVFDRWREPGDIATYPRLTLESVTHGSANADINTDLWLHDGSFIRLRNISLSYQLPKITDVIKNATITFSATNLLTFTNFVGLDPEIARDFENSTDRNMSGSITFLTPPQEKSFNVGININF